MKRALLSVLAAAGCFGGDPVEPSHPSMADASAVGLRPSGFLDTRSKDAGGLDGGGGAGMDATDVPRPDGGESSAPTEGGAEAGPMMVDASTDAGTDGAVPDAWEDEDDASSEAWDAGWEGCGADECGDHETCISEECVCETLFHRSGSGVCVSVCETAQQNSTKCDSGGHGRCQIASDHSASCTSCLPGFIGDGVNCTANPDCATLGCAANTICDVSGGARCACAPGYDGDPNSSTGCTDIDECSAATNPCGGATCVNAPGSYVCAIHP